MMNRKALSSLVLYNAFVSAVSVIQKIPMIYSVWEPVKTSPFMLKKSVNSSNITA